jgi:hypothetical protein
VPGSFRVADNQSASAKDDFLVGSILAAYLDLGARRHVLYSSAKGLQMPL